MQKSDSIEVEGTILEVLPNNVFRAELPNGHRLLAHVSGEMRMNFEKVLPGDKVLLEISLYDLSRGRVIRRQK